MRIGGKSFDAAPEASLLRHHIARQLFKNVENLTLGMFSFNLYLLVFELLLMKIYK
jgi:hypothetical protein